MYKTVAVLLIALCALAGARTAPGVHAVPRVIFDTDFGFDVDDAGALAVLHALADLGEAEILATMSTVSDPLAPFALDVINTYYGRPVIPIGRYSGDKWSKAFPYWRALKPHFLERLVEFPHGFRIGPADAVWLYRRVLSRQPDNSVTIVAVGFLQNLSDLLDSGPDRSSPLSGRDLVARKVKMLTIMGGSYPASTQDFNIGGGVANSARETRNVLMNWPGEIVMTPGNVCGGSLSNGHTLSKATPETNPVRAAYEEFSGGPNRGRTSWDLCTVLYGVRGLSDGDTRYFSLIENQRLTVKDDKSHRWVSGGEPHGRLVRRISESKMEAVLEALLTAPPARRGD